jgi:hypothetical protein
MKSRIASLTFSLVLLISATLATSASATSGMTSTHRLVPPAVFSKVERVHMCEEPTWHVRGSLYRGGLGWLDATWQRYKLPGFPMHADEATPQQQSRAMLRFVTVAMHGYWPDQHGCTGGY